MYRKYRACCACIACRSRHACTYAPNVLLSSPQRRHWSEWLSSGGCLDSTLVAQVQRKTCSPQHRELTRLECLARPPSLSPLPPSSQALSPCLTSWSANGVGAHVNEVQCIFERAKSGGDAASSRRRMNTRPARKARRWKKKAEKASARTYVLRM